jgi:hypothetical protein
MDLLKILGEMHEELERLNTIIASLEAMETQAAKSRGKRVTKGMDPAARKAASERMKSYWAARKQQESAETK